MARKVFYSFHYKPDVTRVARVRNIGALEDNPPASDNDWETITKGGASAIKRWINDQMRGRSCVLVLVGSKTAGRKWIKYEIERAWKESKGLAGIHIHGLKNLEGKISSKGRNPFEDFTLGSKKLSSVVKCYNPSGTNSQDRYNWIRNNLEKIVENAIKIRKNN